MFKLRTMTTYEYHASRLGRTMIILNALVGLFLGLVVLINVEQLKRVVWSPQKIGLVVLVAIIFLIISMNSTIYVMSLFLTVPLSLLGLYFLISLLLNGKASSNPN